MRKISLLLLLLLSSIFVNGQKENKVSNFIQLDTTCVFSNDESFKKDELFISANLDSLSEVDIVGMFKINRIDSITFNKIKKHPNQHFYQEANRAIKIITDSCLIIQTNKFKWIFTSNWESDTSSITDLIGDDNRQLFYVYGVLPKCLGIIPHLNLAIVNLVDIEGAYASTHLLDLTSGKLMDDLSDNDVGVDDYVANKNHIAYFTNSYFERYEGELGLMEIIEKKNHRYCLKVKSGIKLPDYIINDLKWGSANNLFVKLKKITTSGSEEEVFLKMKVN